MSERLRVTTFDGKYTVIQTEDGDLRFLRHGEPWSAADRDLRYVGMILAMAHDLETYKTALEEIADEQKVYKGHGDFDIIPALDADEAQSRARKALSHH